LPQLQEKIMASPTFKNYEEFWPYYVAQHLNPTCRRMHFIGTTFVHIAIGALIMTQNPLWLLAAPIVGYAFAWIGHFGFEKNKPATFGHPFWSLRADFRMYYRTWAGTMDREVELARAGSAAS
jgi:hypothetical protein